MIADCELLLQKIDEIKFTKFLRRIETSISVTFIELSIYIVNRTLARINSISAKLIIHFYSFMLILHVLRKIHLDILD